MHYAMCRDQDVEGDVFSNTKAVDDDKVLMFLFEDHK